jgi:poly[(R)-3-hydroxyalkanoate] polymerase subunit PhaC
MTTATNPGSFWMEWQKSLLEESCANARRFSRLPSLWERARRLKKGVSPSEVVYEEDRLKVLHYLSEAKPRFRTPLLFVYALVNRPYILDLRAGRSVVSHFVKQGFDTYLVDWGIPTHADRYLTLDDYINGYLPRITSRLADRTGASQVNLLGYCMGGTMSAMFTALYQPSVKNLILLAAPIDFATGDAVCSTSGRNPRSLTWTASSRLSAIVLRNSCRPRSSFLSRSRT